MFNDLTDNKNQKEAEVDDIFAETDNIPTPDNSNTPNQIKTRQVGLSSLSENSMNQEGDSGDYDNHDENVKTGKFLKIAIIAVIVAIFILGGYLVYSKFFAANRDVVIPTVSLNEENNEPNFQEEDVFLDEFDEYGQNEDDYVLPIIKEDDEQLIPGSNSEAQGSEGESDSDLDKLKEMDTDGDGLSDYDEIYIYKTDPTLADTDGDGLSDYDEIFIYKTDPLKVDTDGDGLTDYEEVMVHKTDPLNIDTDGDGFSDYEEVMNGYNPLGEG